MPTRRATQQQQRLCIILTVLVLISVVMLYQSSKQQSSPMLLATSSSASSSATTAEELPLPPVKKSESALKSFLSGGVGGICVVLVGHPLDLIKVRMQTAGAASAGKSVVGMFMNTFRTEGIRGLYRGVSAPLTAVTPLFATSFWGYDMGQRLIQMYTEGADLTLFQKCVAGGLSAIPTTIITAPSERVKCLLQIQSDNPKYSGMKDCAMGVYKSGGLSSLYRGTFATLLRDIPGSVAWFGTYEFVKLSMMQMQGIEDMSKLSPSAVLTAGGLAGMACWMVSIPADVLKSRYQTAPDGMYRGLWDVYTKLMKEEGAAGLFTGIRPALIRAFPANAACFFGMEVARKVFGFMD